MRPHEINYRVCEGLRKQLAERLGKSQTLIDKQCAVPERDGGNGCTSWTENFLAYLLALRSLDPSRAKLLLDYINGEAGCAPCVAIDATSEPASLADVALAVRLAGEWLGVIAEAYRDGVLSSREASEALARLDSLHSVTLPASAALHRFIAADDDRIASTRIGPKPAPRLHVLRRLASA